MAFGGWVISRSTPVGSRCDLHGNNTLTIRLAKRTSTGSSVPVWLGYGGVAKTTNACSRHSWCKVVVRRLRVILAVNSWRQLLHDSTPKSCSRRRTPERSENGWHRGSGTSFAIGVQENELLRSNHPAEFIKSTKDSSARALPPEFSEDSGAKALS